MKKKILLITLAIIAVMSFASCGGEKQTRVEVSGINVAVIEDYEGGGSIISLWRVEISPITGRYYELYIENGEYIGMSEVTEQEYLKYLEMIGEE